jgi:hypothetical protein
MGVVLIRNARFLFALEENLTPRKYETIKAKYLAVNSGRITVAVAYAICTFVSLDKFWRLNILSLTTKILYLQPQSYLSRSAFSFVCTVHFH